QVFGLGAVPLTTDLRRTEEAAGLADAAYQVDPVHTDEADEAIGLLQADGEYDLPGREMLVQLGDPFLMSERARAHRSAPHESFCLDRVNAGEALGVLYLQRSQVDALADHYRVTHP